MSEQLTAVVPGEESEIHDEPHIRGRRITVQFVQERVEGRGLAPETFADRHDLTRSQVYHALAYYHDNRAEMKEVERQRKQAESEHAHLTTDPSDVRE